MEKKETPPASPKRALVWDALPNFYGNFMKSKKTPVATKINKIRLTSVETMPNIPQLF